MVISRLKEEFAAHQHAVRAIEDFAPLIERLKHKRIVMLGEATHGTREFYEWRALLTRELIEHHGFQFVAVEGDWPACQKMDAYVNDETNRSSFQVLSEFTRWPTWMWGNEEIKTFIDTLRVFATIEQRRIGFHGLDLYSFYDSIHEVIRILDQHDSDLARKARELYSCFEPYLSDERAYVRSLIKYPKGCEDEAVTAMQHLLQRSPSEFFDATQNARVVRSAESFYRAMISADDRSWNVRDVHMMETLEMLLDHYGSGSKAVVWAHNTHVGDYRATDMLSHDLVNLGGLARERWGNRQVALVGFSTFQGEVVASHAWDGPIQTLRIPPARPGSLEKILHDLGRETGSPNFYLDLEGLDENAPLNEWINHRAIGVVYQPEFESKSNYVPTRLGLRYDAMIYFDETHALHPLHSHVSHEKIPESYPFGDRL